MKKNIRIPVRLLNRSNKGMIFSIPKSCSNEIIMNNTLKVGNRYLVEVKKELEVKKYKVANTKQIKKPFRDCIPITISMDREFAEKVIDKEFLGINEMQRENRINDLTEALEYIQLRYSFITNEMMMGD